MFPLSIVPLLTVRVMHPLRKCVTYEGDGAGMVGVDGMGFPVCGQRVKIKNGVSVFRFPIYGILSQFSKLLPSSTACFTAHRVCFELRKFRTRMSLK